MMKSFVTIQIKKKTFYLTSIYKTVSSKDGSNTILSNTKQSQTSFFEHRTNSNVFIYWWSNSNILVLASKEQTLNIELNKAFTRYIKLLIELTQRSFLRTSNEPKHVHLIVIKLEHAIFGFKRSNIELWT